MPTIPRKNCSLSQSRCNAAKSVQRVRPRDPVALPAFQAESCTGLCTDLLKTFSPFPNTKYAESSEEHVDEAVPRYNDPKIMTARMVKKSSAADAPALISDQKLKQMYATMLRCRILNAHARKVARGLSNSKRHEAAVVGAAIDLLPGDTLLFENHAIAGFVQGTRLVSVFETLSEPGKSKKKRESATVILGAEAHVGIATGVALADHSDKNNNITIVFFHSSDSLSAPVRQALAIAATYKLPIIYVSLGPAHAEDTARAFGFPAIPVDGSDVVAVYRVAHECISRTRQGVGPSLIECRHFLIEDTSTKDHASRRDPIRHMEQYLRTKGIFTEAWKQDLIAAFEKKLRRAMSAARTKSTGMARSGKPTPLLHVR